MDNYWAPIESKWASDNGAQLQELLKLSAKTHALVAGVARHEEFVKRPASASVTVQRLLLRRLGEELRGVELLASNGHGFQAISDAANLFEQSHFLTYASSSDQIAEKYLNWNDPKWGIASVKSVVQASGVERGWSQARIDEEYGKYSFLCGFKHNNAVMHRVLLLPKDPDLVLGQFALADSIWFTVSTVGLLAVKTLSPESLQEAIATCNDIMDAVPGLYPKLEVESDVTPPSS